MYRSRDNCRACDMNTSLIRTARGRTIVMQYDTVNPVVSNNSNGVEDLAGKRGKGEVDEDDFSYADLSSARNLCWLAEPVLADDHRVFAVRERDPEAPTQWAAAQTNR